MREVMIQGGSNRDDDEERPIRVDQLSRVSSAALSCSMLPEKRSRHMFSCGYDVNSVPSDLRSGP